MDYQDPYSSDSESDLSLKDALRNIWQGFKDKEAWAKTLEGLERTRKEIPGVAESYIRGGVAQAIGQFGDMRDIQKVTNSVIPERLRNLSNVAQFLSNPYLQTTINRAPTTEQVLEATPRFTPEHEGAKDIEMMGGWTAPGGAGVAADLVKATKGLPVGLTFIGPESKAWNKTMAFEASKLESKLLKEGVPPEEVAKQVWQTTGTARGLGGEWRQEISDLFSAMKGNYKTYGELHNAIIENPEKKGISKIGDVLEHEDLAKAYPQLMDMEIRKMPSDTPYRGKVTYENDIPVVHLRENLPPEEARSVIAHELQHLIQKEEGFGIGGYEGSYTQQADAKIASSAMAVRREAERMDPSIPWEQRVDEASKLLNDLTSSEHFGGETKSIAADLEGNPTDTLENISVLYGTDRNVTPFSPREMYRHIGGEAEARLTQGRLNLGEQGRQENFPFEYQPTRYENMEPLPNPKLDIKPEEAIIHGREPGVIDVGNRRVSGEVKPGAQASMEEPKPDELGFYSPVEKAVMAIGQPKGTGDQFLAQIKKTPGVKQEELAWTGLEDFLKEKKSVTKQEVEDYIKNNKVKIEEHQLGESTGSPYDEYSLGRGEVVDDPDFIDSDANYFHEEYMNDPEMVAAEREAILEKNPEKWDGWEENPSLAEHLDRHVSDALYERARDVAHENYYENPIYRYDDELGYTVYGNDDMGYRIETPSGNDITPRRGIYDISDVESHIRENALENGFLDMGDGAKYEDYTLPGKKDNYREVLLTFNPKKEPARPVFSVQADTMSQSFDTRAEAEAYKAELQKQYPNADIPIVEKNVTANPRYSQTPDYESGHFDQPNILTHLRLDDRVINGKKTLFVEEIQSDWHQEGRKKGYKTTLSKEKRDEIEKQMASNAIEKQLLFDERSKNIDDEKLYDELNEKIKQISIKQQELDKQLNSPGVPNAPFKSTWHELAMKRAMDMAAKGDYEQIAWTTGAQQNSRYNLAKHINDLKITRNQNAVWGSTEQTTPTSFTITATDKNGNRSINKEIADLRNLDEYVGKELSEKIKDDFANKSGHEHTYSGLDLEVGGSGMKGFYDKILPDYVNKQMKKHGVRVETAQLSEPNYQDFKHWAGKKDPSMSNTFMKHSWDNKDDLYEDFVKNFKGEEVHVITIPESMRKDIYGKGQPMFAATPLLALPATKKEEKKTELNELLNP